MRLYGVPGEATTTVPNAEAERGRSFTPAYLGGTMSLALLSQRISAAMAAQ